MEMKKSFLYFQDHSSRDTRERGERRENGRLSMQIADTVYIHSRSVQRTTLHYQVCLSQQRGLRLFSPLPSHCSSTEPYSNLHPKLPCCTMYHSEHDNPNRKWGGDAGGKGHGDIPEKIHGTHILQLSGCEELQPVSYCIRQRVRTAHCQISGDESC